MPPLNFKTMVAVPSAKDFVDIVLSKTQRQTPTVVHNGWAIQRVRQFYMRKVKFTQANWNEKLSAILDQFPKVEDIHPFYSDLLNVLYDKDHYKLALGQINTARGLIDRVCQGASPAPRRRRRGAPSGRRQRRPPPPPSSEPPAAARRRAPGPVARAAARSLRMALCRRLRRAGGPWAAGAARGAPAAAVVLCCPLRTALTPLSPSAPSSSIRPYHTQTTFVCSSTATRFTAARS